MLYISFDDNFLTYGNNDFVNISILKLSSLPVTLGGSHDLSC